MSKKFKIGLIVLFAILILSALSFYLFKPKGQAVGSDSAILQPKVQVYDPPFTKEGELKIQGADGKTIKHLSIEIADNPKEIEQGLMHRSSMGDTLGMLFVFEEPMLHTFWMKNTKIPLDIIFVDENLKIINIAKYTTPFSENQIPSGGDILYALEVNAGFCDKNGVKPGDKIQFNKSNVSVL